jgi:hypothetical protein
LDSYGESSCCANRCTDSRTCDDENWWRDPHLVGVKQSFLNAVFVLCARVGSNIDRSKRNSVWLDALHWWTIEVEWRHRWYVLLHVVGSYISCFYAKEKEKKEQRREEEERRGGTQLTTVHYYQQRSHLKGISPLAISCCTVALSILIWTFT